MTSGALYHHWCPSYNPYCGPPQPTLPRNYCRYEQKSSAEARYYIPPDHTGQQLASQPIYWSSLKMAGSNPGEMEDFQRLSDQYQPDLPGPLIGEKLPVIKLVEEYTAADPTYVAKTQALAATYSGYRRIKGDGQCGWRGAVFGYFETLLQLGDLQLLMQEEVRLQSFADTMRMAGIDYDIIVDMFDFTWELFAELRQAVERQDRSDTILLEWLNDEIKSNSIVYHFKMMTSAFLQLNPDNYEPFLEMPIADYRVARIDPANQEIDQVGLQILTDGVIAQAGFAVDVLYLDRSLGDEVTPHEFAPKNHGRPTIRLLYRPGHYDVIYKDGQSVQVYFQRDSLIPQGMEMAQGSGLSGDHQAYLFAGPQSNQAFPSSSQFDFTSHGFNMQQHPYAYHDHACYPTPPAYEPDIPRPNLSQNYQQTYTPRFSPPPTSPAGRKLSSPTPTTRPLLSPPVFSMKSKDDKIRYVPIIQDLDQNYESVPLCPHTFGSATSSTAHFRNQEFQPQIWNADEYLRS